VWGLLVRLVLKGRQIVQEERYPGDLRERIRDVRQAPDSSSNDVSPIPNGQILPIMTTDVKNSRPKMLDGSFV
jgi:glucose/arabinose dehydrogenase